jgi:SAM-dependent methyltransferase
METGKRVLGPCYGGRAMWFDKANPDVVFGDIRHETITVSDRSHGKQDGTCELRIEPDTQLDFRDLPYPDDSFWLVAFDPPHLVKAGPCSWLAARYGKLGADWKEDLRKGFRECMRVLRPNGTLIFKWNEENIKDSLELAKPYEPLFGHTGGRKGLTHWIVFMKAD